MRILRRLDPGRLTLSPGLFRGALLGALFLAFSSPTLAADQFDRILSEGDLRPTLEKQRSSLVLYHVGKDSWRKGKLEDLIGKLRRAGESGTLYYRVDVGRLSGRARDTVVEDVGRNEFPALVIYRFGRVLGKTVRPVPFDFDQVVEELAPVLQRSLEGQPLRGEEEDSAEEGEGGEESPPELEPPPPEPEPQIPAPGLCAPSSTAPAPSAPAFAPSALPASSLP